MAAWPSPLARRRIQSIMVCHDAIDWSQRSAQPSVPVESTASGCIGPQSIRKSTDQWPSRIETSAVQRSCQARTSRRKDVGSSVPASSATRSRNDVPCSHNWSYVGDAGNSDEYARRSQVVAFWQRRGANGGFSCPSRRARRQQTERPSPGPNPRRSAVGRSGLGSGAAASQAIKNLASLARRLHFRDAVGILGLRRLVMPFVAEGAHRHGNHPERRIGQEGTGVPDRALLWWFAHDRCPLAARELALVRPNAAPKRGWRQGRWFPTSR